METTKTLKTLFTHTPTLKKQRHFPPLCTLLEFTEIFALKVIFFFFFFLKIWQSGNVFENFGYTFATEQTKTENFSELFHSLYTAMQRHDTLSCPFLWIRQCDWRYIILLNTRLYVNKESTVLFPLLVDTYCTCVILCCFSRRSCTGLCSMGCQAWWWSKIGVLRVVIWRACVTREIIQ